MLEVIACSLADAMAAEAGGADRIELVGTMDDDGLSPSPELAGDVCAALTIPVRVMVRTEAGFAATEPDHLATLAACYRDNGADGIVLGFLADGRLDLTAIETVANQIPLTCHRAIDHASDYTAAWSDALKLEGLTSVLTAGSASGVETGMGNLLATASRYPHLALVGGGLSMSHVPRLKEAGLTSFHVGSAVRPNRSFTEPIDPALVETWASLVR